MVRDSWRQDTEERANCSLRASGSQWPMVEQPKSRCKRSAAMVEEELGSICSSLSWSPLISHPQQTSPFENKVWEIYIFIRSVFIRLFKSSLPVNDVSACKCIFVDVHVLLYMAIQHLELGTVQIHDFRKCKEKYKLPCPQLELKSLFIFYKDDC